jgi:glyoxylase-like metal-dependent hydrolase (beta-lactamase superfamily II)
VLIVLFTLTLAVFTVIKFRRKWVISLVPICFALCFAVCFGIYAASGSSRLGLDYVRYSKSESIVIHSTTQAIVCDMSDGSYSSLSAAVRDVSENGISEIEALVLTHYHKKHSYSVGRLMDATKVRSLWLPMPRNESDYYVFASLYDRAAEAGVAVVTYGYGEPLRIFSDASITLNKEYISRSTHPVLSLSLETVAAEVRYFGSSSNELDTFAQTELTSDKPGALILGAHGPIVKSEYDLTLYARDYEVIFVANADLLDMIRLPDTVCVRIADNVEKISVPRR